MQLHDSIKKWLVGNGHVQPDATDQRFGRAFFETLLDGSLAPSDELIDQLAETSPAVPREFLAELVAAVSAR